ncbi:MAG: hypothetical protein WAP52_00005 [Candidatus Sungiibacteriota bacterium]
MKIPMIIGILGIGAALAAAIFCEWVIARIAGGSVVVPPVTVLAVILVMTALPFSFRIWLALAAGFLLDSVALPPFGATILLFVFLAGVMEIVRAVMADRKSYFAKTVTGAGLCLLAYGAAPLARVAAVLLRL